MYNNSNDNSNPKQGELTEKEGAPTMGTNTDKDVVNPAEEESEENDSPEEDVDENEPDPEEEKDEVDTDE